MVVPQKQDTLSRATEGSIESLMGYETSYSRESFPDNPQSREKMVRQLPVATYYPQQELDTVGGSTLRTDLVTLVLEKH